MTTLKAAVVYDSNFGNNLKLAEALTRGLERSEVTVDCLKVGSFDVHALSGYDFLAVGGPTNIARMSKAMQGFFEELRTVDIRGKRGFCFGTRMDSRMNLFDINGSAKRIEGKLRKKKVHIIKPRVNVLVEGREGPMTEGSEHLFEEIGAELADLLGAA